MPPFDGCLGLGTYRTAPLPRSHIPNRSPAKFLLRVASLRSIIAPFCATLPAATDLIVVLVLLAEAEQWILLFLSRLALCGSFGRGFSSLLFRKRLQPQLRLFSRRAREDMPLSALLGRRQNQSPAHLARLRLAGSGSVGPKFFLLSTEAA